MYRSVERTQSVVGIIATKRIVTSPSSMSYVPLGVGMQTNRNNKRASQQIVSTDRRTSILQGASDVYKSSPVASAASSSSAGLSDVILISTLTHHARRMVRTRVLHI